MKKKNRARVINSSIFITIKNNVNNFNLFFASFAVTDVLKIPSVRDCTFQKTISRGVFNYY